MGWNAKQTGGYATNDLQAQQNANEMATTLTPKGWSLRAVCAMLGNVYLESGYNPWRWQGDNVPTESTFQNWDDTEEMRHGYGLFQFTPAKRYINRTTLNNYQRQGYSPKFFNAYARPTDGKAQTLFMADNFSSYWDYLFYDQYKAAFISLPEEVNIDDFWDMTVSEFLSATWSDDRHGDTTIRLDCLVGAFELHFEKPGFGDAASSYQTRINACLDWRIYFAQNPPKPTITKRFPLWMMIRFLP